MDSAATSLKRMRRMLAQGQLAHAADAAHMLLAVSPESGEAHALLGKLAARHGDADTALHHLERVDANTLAVDPDAAAARGVMLVRVGRYIDAIAPLRLAANGSSDPLGNLLRLAWVFERLGRFEELRGVLGEAHTLAARFGHDIRVREAILLARTEDWDKALATLDGAEGLSGEERLARGRLRDRAGRYDEAWQDFVGGKRDIAATQRLSYPAAAVATHFEKLAAVFTPDRMAHSPGADVAESAPQPIFVAGAPRSGTTLAERLITQKGEVDPRGELSFVPEVVGRLTAELGAYPDALATDARGFEKRFGTGIRDAYLGLCRRDTRWAAPRFTDKMPFNEQHLPLISLAFPSAPVVIMTRHPLDVIVSMMSHQLTHGFHCALDPADAAHHLVAVDRLTEHWKASGCRFARMRYEDLVHDPSDGEIRLLEIVGVASEETAKSAMKTVAATPSYADVGGPVERRSLFRWQNYAEHMREIIPLVAEIAQRRGYDLD